jgi:hypothetical protein
VQRLLQWKSDKLRILNVFVFWTMHFLKVNKKPTNALIIQCIGVGGET